MILIAIGANLPDPKGRSALDTCRWAAAALDTVDGTDRRRLRALSHWYVTAPVPASDQPDYINGMALLEGDADAAELLLRLHALEALTGRQRDRVDAARTLDLDIIAIGCLVRDHPDPVLPHPRAHQRGFVLYPLRDVAPGWVHPRLGRTVECLIAELPPQQVRAL